MQREWKQTRNEHWEDITEGWKQTRNEHWDWEDITERVGKYKE